MRRFEIAGIADADRALATLTDEELKLAAMLPGFALPRSPQEAVAIGAGRKENA